MQAYWVRALRVRVRKCLGMTGVGHEGARTIGLRICWDRLESLEFGMEGMRNEEDRWMGWEVRRWRN